jgi:hypothetical protein
MLALWRAIRQCRVAHHRGRRPCIDLKRQVKAPGKSIYRPAVGIVAGVGDELIIERERGGRDVAAIRLENLLEPGIR